MDRWALLLSDPRDSVLDLRSVSISSLDTGASPDLLVQAQQVHQAPLSEHSESSTEEPSSPSSSIDSHSGFYSLVDDPSSPEAELNTAWMVSAQRQNQLATLKEERAFKLQTYSSSRRPRSLFPEEVDGGDTSQQEELEAGVEVVPVPQEEERRLRQEIIRSQAPRNKPVPAAGFNTRDLDLYSSRLLDGFSPVHSRPEPLAPPAVGTVDKEQINFNAARQQFLRMEQQNQQPDLLDCLTPSSINLRTRPTQGVASSEQQRNRVHVSQDIAGPDRFEIQRKDSSRSQDLASNETTSQRRPTAGQWSSRSTKDQKTPIQRTIRLVQEREEKLRLSHGMKRSDDKVQSQVTSNYLNSVLNLVPVQQGVQIGSKNQRRDSGMLRHYSLEAPQKPEDRVDNRFSSPCCPHRHSEETELLLSQRTSAAPWSPRVQETKGIYQDRLTSPFSHVLLLSPPSSPGSWRENLESSGLQSRGQGTPKFIQQEIEESLRREKELRELRASRTQLRSFAPDPLVEHTPKGAVSDLNRPRPAETSTVSPPSGHPVTCQPSSSFTQTRSSRFRLDSSSSSSPSSSCLPSKSVAPPAVGGLTETLLQDYQERQVQLRLEENSYAGIQPVDDINNEVVESTRVIRHKNQRALRWEAGHFANQENP